MPSKWRRGVEMKRKYPLCKVYKLSPTYAYKKYLCKCSVCIAYRKLMYKKSNKAKAKERSRIWRLNNLERSRNNSKLYQKNHPEQLLKWQLKKYGITLEIYNKFLKKQNNECAICGNKARGMQHSKKRLCIDHDKKTGKVRGLLCGACNIGIGHLEHSANLLKKAIKYLK
jgi:hypothetical protein